jgi:lipopolysaccharide transport system permease protein
VDKAAGAQETVIAPGRGGLAGALAECWKYHELLYFLTWRDIKVRYKQTVLGALWAVLRPFVTMVVFTLVFHHMAELRSGEIPYPIFAYAGLLPWMLFQSALVQCSGSLVNQARLLTKVYFPRLLVPLSSVGSGLVDFAISFFVLIAMMFYYGAAPTWRICCLPVFVALAVVSALSVGVWFAALSAKYRDFRYAVPFLVRIWLFLSPVAYPSSSLREKLPPNLAWAYDLNPMTGVVEGFRWTLFGADSGIDAAPILISGCGMLALMTGGLFFFRRMERTFADML